MASSLQLNKTDLPNIFRHTVSHSIFKLFVVEIPLRLQGPLSTNGSGRVEIFYKGEWGTICDDHWDIDDARVACRQLGYKYGVRALPGGRVPSGSGRIWLDDVGCTGKEQNLSSCSHVGWKNHKCGHSEDAGVECASKGKIIILYLSFKKSLIILGQNAKKIIAVMESLCVIKHTQIFTKRLSRFSQLRQHNLHELSK